MILKIRQALGGIFDILGDIAVNETGFVRQRSGFAAAWVVGMLVVGAVFFGMPDQAEAGFCNQYTIYTCTQGQHAYCDDVVCPEFYGCPAGECRSYSSTWKCYCCDPPELCAMK